MNKAARIVYTALFLGICCAPLAMMPFMSNDEQIEKKELAERPSIIVDGKLNTGFSEQFESWFNDRLPLRSELLSAANLIKGEMLGSPSSNVISGSDGWLFYENTKSDYMDTDPMSMDEVNSAAVTVSLIEENVKSKGGRFVFVVMPNKASIYSEYMPSCYSKARVTNLDRLTSRLSEMGVNQLDMKKLLTDNKDLGLYHKRDTHWNYMGALLGYDAIMNSLGREHKAYAPNYTLEKDWRGDLDKLLYPSGGFMDYQYRFDTVFDEFRFTTPSGVSDTQAQLENFMSDKEDGDIRIVTRKNERAKNGRLYMVRDSFGRALLPYMIDNYTQATFVRTDCPELTTVSKGTDMVYEIVERNLRNLTNTAPFMYAPQREGIKADGILDRSEIEAHVDYEGYGTRIYGIMPGNNSVTSDGRVYVRLTGNGEEHTFEAFPILEKRLLGKEGSRESGFSLILDPSLALEGEYSVSLISQGRLADNITQVKFEKGEDQS